LLTASKREQNLFLTQIRAMNVLSFISFHMDRPGFFEDRHDAGRQLAERLEAIVTEPAVVYALPRGGVPVAVEIARRLKLPLDLALVRKIGAPGNPEVALGAVSDGAEPQAVINESVLRASGASRAYVLQEAARELEEIKRRRRLYFGDGPAPDPRGKTAIVVDDGLATGATARVAVESLRKRGARKVILAVPVAPAAVAERLRSDVDDLVCIHDVEDFASVSRYYRDFHQLSDDEVLGLLSTARSMLTAARR
jgi:predicted phosphoribosyltransferase